VETVVAMLLFFCWAVLETLKQLYISVWQSVCHRNIVARTDQRHK